MKNKYLFIIVCILAVIAAVSSRDKSTTFLDTPKTENTEINLYDPNTQKINNMDLEEYVLGVVAAEMPASFNEEALKAQAIAARTYAVYKMENTKEQYDVITDISNQAYITEDKMKEKWKDKYTYYYEKVKSAVDETKNIIMTYNDKAIIAYYFAMSNGNTEDAALVFGENKEYLESVDSSWDKSVNNYEVINTISKTEFCTKLNIECNNIIIGKIEKSPSGRVNTIVINNKQFKGTEVRKLLGLRSTDFEIKISKEIEITTKGYGHGVGMSQYGANEMAKLGHTYTEILNYYYKNIKLETINV